jgi:hypothetical protein
MGFAQPVVIHFETLENGKLPYPVHVDGDGKVTHGLPYEDIGALLVGFGPMDEQRVDIYREAAIENPESVVGMRPTFSWGTVFAWDIPVSRLHLVPTEEMELVIPDDQLAEVANLNPVHDE